MVASDLADVPNHLVKSPTVVPEWHRPDRHPKCTLPGTEQDIKLELNKETYTQMGKVRRVGSESMTTFAFPSCFFFSH